MRLPPEILRNAWSHPANQGRRLRAMLRVLGWQAFKRTRGGYWDQAMPGGLRLRCHAGYSMSSRMLYTNGHCDWDEMWFVRHYLRAGDGFLDIGANIGAYTVLAASIVGPTGRIAAFEPGETFDRLQENVTLNALEQVSTFHSAVSAEPGTVWFTRNRDTTNQISTDQQNRDDLVEVPAVRLADVVGDQSWALAKVDVEGAEPLVFQGAVAMFEAANPPVWLLELSDGLTDFGWTRERVRDWLEAHGFDLYLYDAHDRRLRPERTPWHERGNVLAVARDRIEQVRERLRPSPSP